jgi:glutathione peroxidase
MKSGKFLTMILSSFAIGCSRAAFPAVPPSDTWLQIPIRTLDRENQSLETYRGKVLLVVNTASQCGYTPQYAGLEKLQQKYREREFSVLGFPSNDFGGQEPGANAQIKLFCKGTYKVDFPLFEKGPVSGEAIQPLFAELLRHSKDSSPIRWNFEKFLVSRTGKVLSRYLSDVVPESEALRKDVEAALREQP